MAYIILPWFGSQFFKKLPGVSGSIRPKPVLIKSLRLGRSWGQKASLLLRIMECPSLQQCRILCLLKFLFYSLTKGNAIILLIIIPLAKDDECFPGEEYCFSTLLNSQSSELCFLKLGIWLNRNWIISFFAFYQFPYKLQIQVARNFITYFKLYFFSGFSKAVVYPFYNRCSYLFLPLGGTGYLHGANAATIHGRKGVCMCVCLHEQ